MCKNKILALGCLIVLNSIDLAASEFKFGINTNLSKPGANLGDILSKKIGYGIGTSVLIEFNQKHSLIPQINFTQYRSKNTLNNIQNDYKASMLGLGLDYRMTASVQSNQKWFVSTGAGVLMKKFTGKRIRPYYSLDLIESDANDPYLQAGLGLTLLNKIEMEIKYRHSDFARNSKLILNSTSFDFCIGYRF